MSADVPYLELLNGPNKGTQYKLLAEMISIGRTDECDIVLGDTRGVSRRHAQVMLLDGRVRVRDLDSQNGTSVDGKRVKDAVLTAGCKVKVGEALFQLVVPNANVPAAVQDHAARRPSSRRMARRPEGMPTAANGQQPLAPGGALDSELMMQAAGEGSRRFLVSLLLMGMLLLGGLYIVSVALRVESVPRAQQAILKKGEARIVCVRVPFQKIEVQGRTEAGGRIVSVDRYGSEPRQHLIRHEVDKTSKDNAARSYPALYFLVVQGEAWGNTDLILKDAGGHEVQRIEMIVRGVSDRDRWLEDVRSKAEARSLVQRFVADAERLQKDGKLFQALQKYEEADQVIRSKQLEEPTGVHVGDSIRSLRLELQKLIEKRLQEAMFDAFPKSDPPRPPNYLSAYITLETAKQLVPDTDNLEWQILDFWQAELRRLER